MSERLMTFADFLYEYLIPGIASLFFLGLEELTYVDGEIKLIELLLTRPAKYEFYLFLELGSELCTIQCDPEKVIEELIMGMAKTAEYAEQAYEELQDPEEYIKWAAVVCEKHVWMYVTTKLPSACFGISLEMLEVSTDEPNVIGPWKGYSPN